MKVALFFMGVCLAAALAPLRPVPIKQESPAAPFPGWVHAPIPPDVRALSLGEKESHLTRDFPGCVAAFTDGERTYIVRWITQPTRKLHPVSDCLRALGHTIQPGPIHVANDGKLWGSYRAQRDGQELNVRERVVDLAGQGWTDVSTWYWHAVLGKTRGPWWSVAVLSAHH